MLSQRERIHTAMTANTAATQLCVFILLLALSAANISCSAGEEKTGRAAAVTPGNYTIPPVGGLSDRVQPTPDFVLDYFAAFDKDIIPENKPYLAYYPTEQELAEIKYAVEMLPDAVREKISPHVAGIYFIENMIGSGWTEWFTDDSGTMYFVLAFNSSVLKKEASQWLSDKERSAFKTDDPAYSINIDIGAGMSGFYYIFYHEAGHLLDYLMKVTPCEPGIGLADSYERMRPKGLIDRETYPFAYDYWLAYRKPVNEYDFAGRDKISFYGLYGGPEMDISQSPQVYERLDESPFITLYGATSYMEDFAEYFAAYMNSRVLDRPWRLTVEKGGELLYSMENPLDRPGIEDRVGFIESVASGAGL